MKYAQTEVLLQVRNIKKYFPITTGFLKRVTGYLQAVDDVSFSVYKNETLGIVGESGCGKTTLGKMLLRLYEPTSGEIIYRNKDGKMKNLLDLNKKESFQTRKRIQIIFQDPYASLNPMKNILTAFDEPMKIHNLGKKEKRREIIADILRAVNLQPDYMYRYPHEFSGGQRQRICIAKALAMNPEIIVCDEPVSALDVSIQSQIMNLMRRLQREFNLTYIFIAHDLSVVQYMSSRVAVMYLGKIVELADAKVLYENCLHPYTKALLSAVPIPVVGVKKFSIILKGDVPSSVNPPKGCHFNPRCAYSMDICKEQEPPLISQGNEGGHYVACHLYPGSNLAP